MSSYEPDTPSHYDTAQVCLSGHTITDRATDYPQHRRDFCPQCGEKTINACQFCGQAICGDYVVPGVFGSSDYTRPSFCSSCGKPYPWTSKSLEAARSLADEIETLSGPDRITLKSTLDDLIRDTPQTAVAVVRFRKLAMKGGPHIVQAFKDILLNIVSDAVSRQIWGPGA